MNKSDLIGQCTEGAVNNPYQGKDRKVLFVCFMGILRSATAARIYAHKYNTRSCGVSEEALIPITQRLIDWADEVVFVTEDIAVQAFKAFNFKENYTILNIPDNYNHMEPGLIQDFAEQYEGFEYFENPITETETT